MEDAIYHHAPEGRPDLPEENRRRYAKRIVAHAFGIAGDVQFAQNSTERKKQLLEREKPEGEARQEERQAQRRQEEDMRQVLHLRMR